MSLVEDYLRAVALLLPKDKREDIIDELRELILSRIESREAELSRPLTDDETETVLRQLGHPLVVASRYRDGPQQVVGPAIYPFWMFAVKAAVTIQLALAVMIFTVRAFTGDVARAFGQAIASGFTGALILIGVATVVAWLIERGVIRIAYFDTWRVKDLRFMGFAAWDADAWSEWLHAHKAGPAPRNNEAATPRAATPSPTPSTSESTMSSQTPYPGAAAAGPDPRDPYYWGKRGRRAYRRANGYGYGYRRHSPVSRGLGAIAGGVVLLLWWLGAIRFGIASGVEDFRALGLEPGALASADWAAVKAGLYLPILLYGGLIVTMGAVLIAHPDARRVHGLIDLAIAAVVLATVGWLWTVSPIASAVRVETIAEFARRMRDSFSDGPPFALGGCITLLLVIVGFGAVIRAVRGVFELILPSATPWPPVRANGAAGLA